MITIMRVNIDISTSMALELLVMSYYFDIFSLLTVFVLNHTNTFDYTLKYLSKQSKVLQRKDGTELKDPVFY